MLNREGLASRGIDNKINQQSGIKFNTLKKEDRLADSNCLATLGGTTERIQVPKKNTHQN